MSQTPPVHPGVILRGELAGRGMTQAALASAMRRPAQAINEIITGKKTITAETALGLEDVLGIGAMFWLHAQAAYDLARVRRSVVIEHRTGP